MIAVLDPGDASIRSGAGYRRRTANVNGFIVFAVNHEDRAFDLAYIFEHVMSGGIGLLFGQPSQPDPQYLPIEIDERHDEVGPDVDSSGR